MTMPVSSVPEVSFYFNHLHQHSFYGGETKHNDNRAHSTQVLQLIEVCTQP